MTPLSRMHRALCALLVASAASAAPQRAAQTAPAAPGRVPRSSPPRPAQGIPVQQGQPPGQQGQPGAGPQQQGQAQPGAAPPRWFPGAPAGVPGAPQLPSPPATVGRFGKFDLDVPLAQLARLPELQSCEAALLMPAGHAECALPPNDDKLGRVQLAWEETKPGGELVALRLLFEPALAPPLTDLESQLTRGWGPPALEQLRRERDQKFFTLQWEDPDHRTTLDAAGPYGQGSRAVALVIERKPRALTGDLATLRPRPFPGMRLRMVRRLEWEGQPHAVVWATSLSGAQEALGESGPAWNQQRSYVGIFRLEPPTDKRGRRWRPLWERVAGEDDDDPQRVVRIETRDITSDGAPDVEVELSCATCGNTASEVLVKTVRAGKLVDLLSRRELYRAQVELSPGKVRVRQPEGEDGMTVTTYAYDRSKGAFVLAHEERVGGPTVEAP